MRIRHTFIVLSVVMLSSCINIVEEPIITINPTAQISVHVKNQKVYATAQINVNPQIHSAGNLPVYYEYMGEVAIYNTKTGNVIDVNGFTGGGLSQYYTVSADTTTHERFIVIAQGSIDVLTDVGKDDDPSNDKLVATGEFHNEAEIIIANLESLTEE